MMSFSRKFLPRSKKVMFQNGGVDLYMDKYGNWVGCRLVFGRHFSNSTIPICLVLCKDLTTWQSVIQN